MRSFRTVPPARPSPLVLVSGLIALALVAWLARAAEEAPPLDLRYGLYWAGFQIASSSCSTRSSPTATTPELIIETVGLLDQLVRYRAKTSARRASSGRAGACCPSTFSTAYQSRRKARTARVTFDPASRRRRRRLGSPNAAARYEQSARSVASGRGRSADRVLEHPRAHRRRARAGTSPSAHSVFDGRRRYDLAARVTGHDRARLPGTTRLSSVSR